MRRPRFALNSAFAALGLMVGIAPAQQSPQATGTAPAASADPGESPMATRPARYALRNGMDYLAYREYDRALGFFRAIENRQAELNPAEQLQLQKGIAKAQEGKREAVNSARSLAATKGRSAAKPGGFALAKAAPANDGIQLTGASAPAEAAPVAVALAAVVAPSPGPAPAAEPAQGAEPAPIPIPAEVASLPEPAAIPAVPASLPAETTSDGPMPVALPPATRLAAAPADTPDPVFGARPAEPASAPADGLDLPSLPAPAAEPAPSPVVTPPPAAFVPSPSPGPAAEASPPPLELPALPAEAPASDPATAPAQATGPSPSQVPMPAPGSLEPGPAPAAEPAPEPPPAAEATPTPGDAPASSDVPGYDRPAPTGSILNRRHREEIERIAQRTGPSSPGDPGGPQSVDPGAGAPPTQSSTRLELIRAPSPTEARPIRRVPTPEEYVPLGPREWNPNRKYWAPAGTCHMILYFQDPVLERYGQSVEQSLGPLGRYFSYPLDDPKQSNQRNQILQPFWSIGKFCFQVGTLPYKLVVDPPWEAEYDLGYYRPGDVIPPDTIMITPTGVGPPLKGRKY